MTAENLLPEPETRLPAEPEVVAALAAASGDLGMLRAAVTAHPTSSLAWVTLADATFDPDAPLESYAYARVGYHRGLDALRRAGWRGQGPVPWTHEPNRGVLRSLYALRRAAAAIGEADEVARLDEFLAGADPDAAAAIEETRTAEIPVQQNPVQHHPSPPTEAIVIRGED
ncbi:DUF3151 domain-containing protein [Rathayibacter soli]|uniref:DUF3151 domain-containing protein n=1 Tax=Rathayibacter soli TaxID=3144168 RepID=UPI0027E410B1|nr:DUF3151 domain-containing protein [Glaciibacter superstes]